MDGCVEPDAIDAGVWTKGDVLSELRILFKVRNDSGVLEPYPLTAADDDAFLELRSRDRTLSLSKELTIEAGAVTTGATKAVDIGSGWTPLGTKTSERFYCYPKLVKPAGPGWVQEVYELVLRLAP